MTWSWWLTLTGLLANFIGVVLIIKYQSDATIEYPELGIPSEDIQRHNRWVLYYKIGLCLFVGGFFLQLIAHLLDP
jgi:hypothetical protein